MGSGTGRFVARLRPPSLLPPSLSLPPPPSPLPPYHRHAHAHIDAPHYPILYPPSDGLISPFFTPLPLASCLHSLPLPTAQGTDDKFVHKARDAHAKHADFGAPKADTRAFSIMHYAGKVTYSSGGFREKNKDTLHPDLSAVLQARDCISSFPRGISSVPRGRSHPFHVAGLELRSGTRPIPN